MRDTYEVFERWQKWVANWITFHGLLIAGLDLSAQRTLHQRCSWTFSVDTTTSVPKKHEFYSYLYLRRTQVTYNDVNMLQKNDHNIFLLSEKGKTMQRWTKRHCKHLQSTFHNVISRLNKYSFSRKTCSALTKTVLPTSCQLAEGFTVLPLILRNAFLILSLHFSCMCCTIFSCIYYDNLQ